MTLRKFLATAALSAALVLPLGAAEAQTGLSAGATVTDPQGGTVGTIVSVNGDIVLLRTDRNEVRLPTSSFTAADGKVLFALTQAQLNAQVEQARAQAQQAFVVGASVFDRNGALIGPVDALDAQTVTVKLGDRLVRLPRSSMAAGRNGLVTGATLAQLQAQVGATQPQPTPDAAATNASAGQ